MRTMRAAGRITMAVSRANRRGGPASTDSRPCSRTHEQARRPAASVPRRRTHLLQPDQRGSMRLAPRRASAAARSCAAARNRRDSGAVSAPASSALPRVARPPARAASCTGGKSHASRALRRDDPGRTWTAPQVSQRTDERRSSWSARSKPSRFRPEPGTPDGASLARMPFPNWCPVHLLLYPPGTLG